MEKICGKGEFCTWNECVMDGESFTRARHDATGDVHKTAEHKTRTNIDETGRRSSPYLTTMMKIFADDEHET